MKRPFKTDFKEQTIGETKKKASPSKPNKLKTYTCRYCKQKYKLHQLDHAKRSMTSTNYCGQEECRKKMLAVLYGKAAKVLKKNQSEKDKKAREDMKTIADWKDDLKKELHWIIKQIDKNYRCISHPEMKNFLRYDAGHYFGAYSNSPIRFNAHNIHKQNSQANQLYGGCPEYRNGLVDRYGEAYAQMVDGLPLKYKEIAKEAFTIDKIKNQYLPAIRAMKKEMKANPEFIPTRDEINATVGIYSEDWLEFQYGDLK